MAARYALNKNKYMLEPEVANLERIIDLKKDPNRDKLMINLALHTGARAQEILNLRKFDLNDGDQTVFITGLKGSNDREIPIKPWLFEALASYCKDMSQDERIFKIKYRRLEYIWAFYRPVKKKFHSLRHTFAIRLYQKHKDIRLVQVALGHRNITNTMIYAEYTYSQQELKKLLL